MLFDLGLEDNGDTMGFTKDNWEFALKRLEIVADKLKADTRVLMTRNVGTGDEEVGPRDAKDTACSGKVMVRLQPQSIDDVIETRIAVVGNGKYFVGYNIFSPWLRSDDSRRWKEYHAWSSSQGWT
jgi:hypothetical protein